MALFMEEEQNRLKCPYCQGRTFYEQPVYAYIKSGMDLIPTLDKTEIVCFNCIRLVHEIKAGKGTIIR
ncbi:hypothetical protein [Bacillus atrophaeus]|uniref:hypothetical protein n=1 Tax=Bacillus atrophaeus TaxID=1452 RepID=UPI002E1FA9A2|nr:hypothetical protein [Bacillus atrophaeus]